MATVLIQNGTLRQGDIVIAGEFHGRVRAMLDDTGSATKTALPAQPVEVLGINGTPGAGDEFAVVTDERSARELAEFRRDKTQERLQAMQQAAKLENMFANMAEGEKRILKVVIKADVRGSLEAIIQAMADIGNDEVSVQVLDPVLVESQNLTPRWRLPTALPFLVSTCVRISALRRC